MQQVTGGKTELEFVDCSDYTQVYKATISVRSRKDKESMPWAMGGEEGKDG